jgi:hypothetical protein
MTDQWAKGYDEGFEEAVRMLAKTGCIRSDIEDRLEQFFTTGGLSSQAQASIRRILESEMPK